MLSKIQYISQGATELEQLENIQSVLDAGCNWIQLRYKNVSENKLLSTAEKVKLICESYKATFIINDYPNIAKKIDADGVHLGLQDMPVTEARNILGPDKIIGGSANTLEDVLNRIKEKCDYVGLGPYRFTTTKEKLSPVLGIEGYKIIINHLEKNKISIPMYAIGGIRLEDAELIFSSGIFGIAISGEITLSSNKKELVSELKKLLHE